MSERTIVFYSHAEIRELKTIANLPKKERATALKEFASKYDRKEAAAYTKMLTLSRRSRKGYRNRKPREVVHVTTNLATVATTGQQVILPFKTVRIEDKNLVFEL